MGNPTNSMTPQMNAIFEPLKTILSGSSLTIADHFEIIGMFCDGDPVTSFALSMHTRDYFREQESAQGVGGTVQFTGGTLIAEIYRRTFFDPVARAKYIEGEPLTNEELAGLAQHLTGSLTMDAAQAQMGSFHATPEAHQ